MKLSISNSGIYDPIKYKIDDLTSDLNSAKNNCATSPSNFSCSGYVNSLSSIISGYIRRASSLEYIAERTNKKYDEYLIDKKTEFNNLNEQIIKERIGLYTRFNDSSQKYIVDNMIMVDPASLIVCNAIQDVKGVVSTDLNFKDESSEIAAHAAERAQNSGVTQNQVLEVDITHVPDTPTSNVNIDYQNNGYMDYEVPSIQNIINDETFIPGSHSPGTTTEAYSATSYNLSDDEYKILCATVYAEASENKEYVYSDTMGVTSSILNRLESGKYAGDTILEIVSAPNQFSGYNNTKYNRAMENPDVISDDMRRAIDDTLSGLRNTEGYRFVGNGTYNSFR